MRWPIPLLLLALVPCPQPAVEAQDDAPSARYHMRQHLDDLRTIERALVAGKLEEARGLAVFFSRPMGVESRHARENRDIVLAASSLVSNAIKN